jgi:toxin YoeB
MKRVWHDDAWDEYLWWQNNDRKILKRINKLIEDIVRGNEGDSGLGKPERLKGDLAGWSSRRVDSEHRLVYRTYEDAVEIVQCRYHYQK